MSLFRSATIAGLLRSGLLSRFGPWKIFKSTSILLKPPSNKGHVHTSTFALNKMASLHKKYGVVIADQSHSINKESPILVVLGWNDSKDKQLAKFSELFREKDFSVVRVTPTSFATFFRGATKAKEISYHVMDTLISLECKHRPVLLYAFSHGGCALYFHMMQALTTSQSKYHDAFSIAGTIFDSCPTYTLVDHPTRRVQEAMDVALKNSYLIKLLVHYVVGITFPVAMYLNQDFLKKYWEDLLAAPLRNPELLLYSKADPLSVYKYIDQYIDSRKKLCVAVTSKCWDDSGHCQHFKMHNEEYVGILKEFIDSCLRQTRLSLNINNKLPKE